MELLKQFIKCDGEYKGLLENRRIMPKNRPKPVMVGGLSSGAAVPFLSSISEDIEPRPKLILESDEKECLRMYNKLTSAGLLCAVYPVRDFMLHNITSSHEYEQSRLSTLAGIVKGTLDYVIATPDAACQLTVPEDIFKGNARTYKIGDTLSLYEFAEYLIFCGYTRVESVDNIAQFSIRGGICDVFVPGDDYPHRMELFGDEIDSIGIFDIISQRRIENKEEFSVFPAREIIMTDESVYAIINAASAQLKKTKKESAKKALEAELDAIDNATELLFADKYINVIYENPSTLFDYFKRDGEYSAIIVDTPTNVYSRLESSAKLENQMVCDIVESEELSSKYARFSISADDCRQIINNTASITLDFFGNASGKFYESYIFKTKNQMTYSNMQEMLCEDVKNYVRFKYAVLLLCENEAVGKNYARLLEDAGIEAPVCEYDKFMADKEELRGKAVILYGQNRTGFIMETSRVACISLYIAQSAYSKLVTKSSRKGRKIDAKEKIMSYADLQVGDYVVHDVHGIGLYEGMKNLTNYEGVSRDFLQIKYDGGSTLYVPCDRLDVLSKYIGQRQSDGTVKLNKMGGSEWGRAKNKVKAAVKEMAKELIDLYAKRMRLSGHAFAKDDDLQRQFESSFEFEETEGQLTAVSDIKRDMEDPHPMDRLLCGDVGFGKTEVALRAAFKAASEGKQVAILVPTTILAMQHYQTVCARMRGYALNIDVVSRFKTPKEMANTLRRLKRGDIDIIIGTHRLISKDVEFRDLGLIIIDEEQRFGVAHKEKLKMISGNADVLTLTATPIPRTLNMALGGIRDMSVLDEPPVDRMPPQTYVMEYDGAVIEEAIRRELRRGGQVFYLSNNVETIERTAYNVSQMAPDASIAIAHGKMDKEELSDIWHNVIEGNIDILVCTTIIETGVDVPNANTLIIENADKMGLSQLHQIRGRIGRSSRRAYAYLTYRPNSSLTEIAARRLSAIREYTEFGSGFKIALRDLEIRGAGNILGSQQHGHIESVGYDMYIKLLNDAVIEETGGEVKQKKTECTVDVQYSAYIPEKYIKSGQTRIEIYKKISHIQNEADLDDVADELLDRFGDLPPSVENLLDISYIRALGENLGAVRIEQKGDKIIITPDMTDFGKWVDIVSRCNDRMVISPGKTPTVVYKIKKGDKPLSYLKKVLAVN